MRKSVYFILCFSFFVFSGVVFSSSQALALQDRCPRHQVQTDLKARRSKTVFQRASISGINGYLNSHSVLAFVQNPLRIVPYFDFSMKDIGGGKYCVMLDRVKVYYVASPRIVMPADFRRSSCEYKIILKHEKRHLQVHYDYHERSTGQYKGFLGRIARRVPIYPPVQTEKEASEVRSNIEDYFAKEFFGQVSKSISTMRKLQEKIDSPQEYLFTGRKINRCAEAEAKKKSGNSKVYQEHKLEQHDDQ